MNDALKVLSLDPPETDGDTKKGRKISRKLLINKLNYLNFQDGSILVHFTHRRYNSTLSLPAKPQVCLDHTLNCLWSKPTGEKINLHDYIPDKFSLDDGKKFIQVKGVPANLHQNGITFKLPDHCYELSARKVKRHACTYITVQFHQNGLFFTGNLLDFSGVSLRVEITTDSPQQFKWINMRSPVNIVLADSDDVLYSGECTILDSKLNSRKDVLVLRPSVKHIQRLTPKKHRGKREVLVPQPTIYFKHPLCKKNFSRRVVNLSGSGFAVEEAQDNTVLFPGLIIPEIEVSFGSSFSFVCRAQVIYKREPVEGQKDSYIAFGLVFMDMLLDDHIKLLSLIYQAGDKFSCVNTKVDLNSLWDFFFETGFLYPQKYKQIMENKDSLKAVYTKLYTESPSIARHFIYQDEDTIVAHMAMIRFYENTWLVHHHASRKSENIRAGLIVLSQASRSLNDSNGIYSAHMDYVMCYYRPDNKFPRRVFGGFFESLGNTKGCSQDAFAYFHCSKTISPKWDLTENWEFRKTTPEDLIELEMFYEHASAGLMMSALDLDSPLKMHNTISDAYNTLGFKRERHLFSLKISGAVKAIAVINISDVGLNMSELTNCIKVIVLDIDTLPRAVLELALSLLMLKFRQPQMPVLLYPIDYMGVHSFPFEKIYNQWILNLQYLDEYLQYCEKLLHT